MSADEVNRIRPLLTAACDYAISRYYKLAPLGYDDRRGRTTQCCVLQAYQLHQAGELSVVAFVGFAAESLGITRNQVANIAAGWDHDEPSSHYGLRADMDFYNLGQELRKKYVNETL